MKRRQSNELRVLVLAPSGRDALLAKQLLEANDIESYECSSIEELYKEIELGSGAVLIASEALSSGAITEMSRVLDRQPTWSDLSIVIVTGAGTGAKRADQLRELRVLTNAVILERPVRAATIINSINIALRARSRQYVLRDHLIDRTRLEMQLANAYHKQFRIAENLQRSMLNHPTKEAFPGVQIDTMYIAAKEEAEVGGDFFDVFALADSRLAVVVGDVSGKGLDAAARSLEVKYPIRAFLRSDASPGATLKKINDYLLNAQSLDTASDVGFVCVCICVIDQSVRTITWSCAGFEGPVFVKNDASIEVSECQSPPAGVIQGHNFADSFSTLAADDIVLLFTDGITESRNNKTFFGIEGVLKCLSSMPTGQSDGIVRTLVDTAAQFSGNENADDICIVSVKMN